MIWLLILKSKKKMPRKERLQGSVLKDLEEFATWNICQKQLNRLEEDLPSVSFTKLTILSDIFSCHHKMWKITFQNHTARNCSLRPLIVMVPSSTWLSYSLALPCLNLSSLMVETIEFWSSHLSSGGWRGEVSELILEALKKQAQPGKSNSLILLW